MTRLVGAELFELDLPFRRPFRHAAASRAGSRSVFLRCLTDTGHCGYGETLPRPYVTGEERGSTFDLLVERILPRLLGTDFASFAELHAFLVECDGKAPPSWLAPSVPQTAAWCLVDLALVDAFSRALGTDLRRAFAPEGAARRTRPRLRNIRYAAVLSEASRGRLLATLLRVRLYGIREVKVKVGHDSLEVVRLARWILGPGAALRVDANMAWTYPEARSCISRMARYGVEMFEQPLPAHDLSAMAHLVEEFGCEVMADESLHDAASLERLIAARACTAVNVRISKCGGLVASLARCRRALEAGLTLQVGCQVGETSQLSAAQLLLIEMVGSGVRYAEGCFGERLLKTDPVRPTLQFRRGGRPPLAPRGAGFGTQVDMPTVRRHAGRRVALGAAIPRQYQETQ